ncbi:MAG TPA: hypothetical protein VLR51_09305, partial [Actinomycetes bacterium]|nr:hypothetical protein [Actinomycetes bacterium]
VVFLTVFIGRIAGSPMYSPSPAVAAAAFPVEVRYSGASISYQLGAIAGGAVAPIIATLIVASPAGVWGVSVYLTAMVALTALGAYMSGRALLTFLWVPFHDRPGSGGQRPPRVRSAMAMSASGLW